MVKASAGCPCTAQFEKAWIALPIGGQIKLRITAATMTAKAVMIGTERLPAKSRDRREAGPCKIG